MNTKRMATIALFTGIMAILSQIVIPLPTGAPISFGVIGVYLAGNILGKVDGTIAMIIYVILGAVGAPIFAGFAGGFGVILGPTGGYIVAYPIMAWIIGSIPKKSKGGYMAAMAIALIFCYTLGTIWLSTVLHVSFFKGLLAGVAPFVVLDILKIIVTGMLVVKLRSVLSKNGFIA